ncbi:tRNA (adenine(22)-N(1))-methyltransferase [Paratissierella segnis]|jgi:tRNA (adenine22-N1)-methyltransferase|uniref:SAM-dependent methyltransferase n=1 Tax=Paratissierella segnis TaxID=2763679 RepID=A0A926EXT2_9FIRM|nr:class I SAM-dependent methyltransferase [Paratissierella segnis]MBC8588364.1 SAM-dependent methyltransferase [Paratissierella segnis]
MKLSNRLKEIVRLTPQNSIVGDIGTDHGYIPAYLIQNNISKYIIATDISQGSLNKAIEYVKIANLENKIETRLGNGLEILQPFEIDTVIIAGMGGLLIKEILEKNQNMTDSITNFIFQPMIASRELRDYLIHNKFKIIEESLAKEDDKFYEIIYAKKGLDFVDKDIYFEIGKSLIMEKHPLLKEFLQNKIQSVLNIIEDLEETPSEKGRARYEELTEKIKDYKEVLTEIES